MLRLFLNLTVLRELCGFVVDQIQRYSSSGTYVFTDVYQRNDWFCEVSQLVQLPCVSVIVEVIVGFHTCRPQGFIEFNADLH